MKKVYFDHNATTPVLPGVIEAMQVYLREEFGNPSSQHDYGEKPGEAIEQARARVAAMIGSNPGELIFTSCGSESNNLAIKGAALANKTKGNHIIISAIEHFSVINSAKALKKLGFEVTRVPVDRYGIVNPDEVRKAITDKTILVSIMHANGVIGVIEPIAEISRILKDKNIIFHTDAVQTAGTIKTDVNELGVDMLSIAGSQFYGPKGTGALYVRKGIRILPLIDGGVQEGGRRAGTENVPAIAGLGRAAELAVKEMDKRAVHMKKLKDKLQKGIFDSVPEVILNGHPDRRLPGVLNVSVKYIEGESMLMLLNMQGIALSSGSACTSKALKASHVHLAIGLKHEDAHGSLLFSLGIDNKEEDVDYLIEALPPIVEKLRKMSPIYNKEK